MRVEELAARMCEEVALVRVERADYDVESERTREWGARFAALSPEMRQPWLDAAAAALDILEPEFEELRKHGRRYRQSRDYWRGQVDELESQARP